MAEKNRLKWFTDARFGMFIHWGLYSMGARGEWLQFHEEIPAEKYERYINYFEPAPDAAEQWASLAEKAGMKYVVFTAKHHEGFCMWDTKTTDFNSVKAPLCRRDMLKEMVEAFRKRNIRIGIYFSLPDWHHPDFPVFAKHPMYNSPRECPNWRSYTGYLHEQVREILTGYGKIDLLWFDGSFPEIEYVWEADKLKDMIRELQPEIVINRLPGHSDYTSPEQYIPESGVSDGNGNPLPWEGCQVFNGDWGYCRDIRHWKDTAEIVQMLIRHISRGGNLLLNIGPDGHGCIDDRSQKILSEVGEWLHKHHKAVIGCTGTPAGLPEPEGCRYTWNPENKRLYLHLFSWPDRRIFLGGLCEKIEYAQMLNDGSELLFEEYNPKNLHGSRTPEGFMKLCLPIQRPDVALPVVELFLKPEAIEALAL